MSEALKGQIGETAEHLITNMRDEQDKLATGNVLRRTCTLGAMLGKDACKQTCQLMGDQLDADPTFIEQRYKHPKGCADNNLENALANEGLEDKNVLMVGVTANEVGFADKLDEYNVTQKESWSELPGFNAFFARETEVNGLGRRLADCADINFEFTDSEGNTVIGFEHGTRTNMFGSTEYAFERDGKTVSFTEYVLGSALEHYGTDPATVRIKLAAAIKGHNFTKHFDSAEKMDAHLPGWYADGFVANISNPDWQPGDPVVEDDTWEADTRSMIKRDISEAMASLGIPAENFSSEGIIDPGDSKGVHSSHQYSKKYGDSRDLYLTFIPQK